ncbi:protein NDRG3 isoform X3 [Magallana gigas]|uniref:protein NDRG3 isoform X3 n=1 Tax=Magallana gigas TaxID=29159 RepID=UPI0005C3847D|nr:protein NDRG3 isoform X3 [Crassostrea gigas]|eukprot:XP_011451232.1 PREDICTED: protein NDRG3 isoform X3 [Crassostrea gigas]
MEKLTEIEFTGINVQDKEPRNFSNNASSILIQEDDIETPFGNLHVAIQGDRSKLAILTFHDIGLNNITCFQGFFNFTDMQPILRHFCVYHVNAPGQEDGALHLRPDFTYPTMDQLGEAIHSVVNHYKIKRFIGFGVGAGVNVLCRYALNHPEHVDSLVLINGSADKAGWVEWGYQKLNSWYLWRGNMTTFTEDYLLWHWFGSKTQWENYDLTTVYKEYIKSINPQNLSLLIESYLARTPLGIERELDPVRRIGTKTLTCQTLLIVGDDSPHLDETVELNGKLDPEKTDFLKIQDCGGMPLEEQPGKVCEAFRLFLQGMGYVPTLRQSTSTVSQVAKNYQQQLDDFRGTNTVC